MRGRRKLWKGLGFVLGLWLAALPAVAADRFVIPAGAGTDCSQGNPCSLLTALVQSADGDSVYVGAGTYTGTGTSVVTLSQTVNLRGGWDGAASGPVVRDPKSHVTTLDGENARRVVTITGAVSPVVDGFVITRGNASGLVDNCTGPGGKAAGCGGGIFSYLSSARISNNAITGNAAAATSTGGPVATTGYGGGIYLNPGPSGAPAVTGNTVTENTGSLVSQGMGGGICLVGGGTGVEIRNNEIVGNQGTTANSAGWGGGIGLNNSEALVEGNFISRNVARADEGNYSQGSGLFQWYGAATIRGNVIVENKKQYAVYLGHGQATFEGNRVIGNPAVGVFIEGGTGDSVTFVNNIVAGNGSGDGAYDYNVQAQASSGFPLTLNMKHSTLAGNPGVTGLSLGAYTTATLVNTLVAGHDLGIANLSPANTTVTADHTLFFGNGSNYGAGVTSTDEVTGDPHFVNLAGGDYHIGSLSAARGVGVAAGVTTDFEGDTRHASPDIGADEYVEKTLSLSVLPAGAGSVTGPGIDCSGSCSQVFIETEPVTVTAAPSAFAVFTGWSGCDIEAGLECTVTMSGNRTVTAEFDWVTHDLTVVREGRGAGDVTSGDGGIDCGTGCAAAYDHGTPVTLTAFPDAHSVFAGWSGGGCQGREPCVVTVDAAKTVTALFSRLLVEPAEGTIGSTVVLTGPGFGAKKGKVLVGGLSAKVVSWRTDTITLSLTKAPALPGAYDVVVQPKDKGAGPIIEEAGFGVSEPIVTAIGQSDGKAGMTIGVTGQFFGSKKGRIFLEEGGLSKACKVASWTMETGEGAEGASTAAFVVPKGLAPGAYTLRVTNAVGSGVWASPFTVVP
jgi:hypothetical protein